MWQLTLKENVPKTTGPHVGFKFSFSNFKTHSFGSISKATKLQNHVIIEINKANWKEITLEQVLNNEQDLPWYKNWLYLGMWKCVEGNTLGHCFHICSYCGTYNKIFMVHFGQWRNNSQLETTSLHPYVWLWLHIPWVKTSLLPYV